MPPSHQLQGKTISSNPTDMTRVSIDFERNYAHVFLGTYVYSPISPTGKGLDESYEADIPVKYIGKSTIEIGEESFSGELDEDIFSFKNVADASFFDDDYSSAMRQIIKFGNPFRYDTGISSCVKNNWDVYFNTAERAERIVSPQHFEDEEDPSSSSSLIEQFYRGYKQSEKAFRTGAPFSCHFLMVPFLKPLKIGKTSKIQVYYLQKVKEGTPPLLKVLVSGAAFSSAAENNRWANSIRTLIRRIERRNGMYTTQNNMSFQNFLGFCSNSGKRYTLLPFPTFRRCARTQIKKKEMFQDDWE